MAISFMSSRSSGASRHIDLSRLPAEYKESGFRGAGVFLIIFSLFWGGMPTLAFIAMLRKGTFEPGQLFFLIFTVIGLGIFIAGLKMVSTRKTLRFSVQQVDYDERSIFGQRIWSEPLSHFSGVRSRSEYHSGGKNHSSYTLYIVELFHPEPRKRLKLYESRSEAGLRGIQETFCRQLNLPAVEGEGAEMVQRRPEDLDKSVGELAREGKLKVNFDPSRPPPPNVVLHVEADHLRIELPPVRIPVGGTIVGLLIPTIFMGIGFGVPQAPMVIGFFGALFLGLVLMATVWQAISRTLLQVGAKSIVLGRRMPWGESWGRTIDTRRLESVRVGSKVDNQIQLGLLLVTDERTDSVGAWLPKETLEWLRDCILAVAARSA